MFDTATAALTTPPGVNPVGYGIGYYVAPFLIGAVILFILFLAVRAVRGRRPASGN